MAEKTALQAGRSIGEPAVIAAPDPAPFRRFVAVDEAMHRWAVAGASFIGICFAAVLLMAGDIPPAMLMMGQLALLGTAAIIDRHRRNRDERQLAALVERGEQNAAVVRDFEALGSEWAWVTDAEGRLTYLSPRVCKLAEIEPQDVLGRMVVDIARAAATPHDQPGIHALAFKLAGSLAFSEHVVPVRLGDQIRWWSLSGRPAQTDDGRFAGFRGIGADLTEMRKSADQIAYMASHDTLTGLANRAVIQETVFTALRHPHGCALLFIDLDRFKTVNDTLGHGVGDLLLKHVARRLLHAVGDNGQIGRLGGDEFAVVLRDTSERGSVLRLASDIIQSLCEPVDINGSTITIGASIGIAFGPEHGATVEELIRNADLALYAAKDGGRNIWRLYAPDMHASAEERRAIEQELRAALTDGGLSLAFQPVVDSATERIVAFEALVRWDHPTRGQLPPTLFVPIAEEAGLIHPLGEWVIRQACVDATAWPSDIIVAVNLSPLQLSNAGLGSVVMQALANAKLAPERLQLEITESVFMHQTAETAALMQQLHGIGVTLALDDFGTGYSSLSYLRHSTFSKIKIDRSFVSGTTDPTSENAMIIRAIVALADGLGMVTTAEGAETHEEIALIRELGCTQIQGFVVSKPVGAVDALELLQRFNNPDAPALVNRGARVSIYQRCVLHVDDLEAPAFVRNLSEHGLMADSVISFDPGTRLVVELPRYGRIGAHVRWCQEGRIGILFDHELRLGPNDPAIMRPERKARYERRGPTPRRLFNAGR